MNEFEHNNSNNGDTNNIEDNGLSNYNPIVYTPLDNTIGIYIQWNVVQP